MIIVSNIFQIAWTFMTPLIIKHIMDSIQLSDEYTFWLWFKIWFAYYLLNYAVFSLFFRWELVVIDIKNGINFYKDWFSKVITLDSQYFDSKWSAKVSTISTDWYNWVANITNMLFYQILWSTIRIFSAFIFIYIFAWWRFFMIWLLIFAIYLYITYISQKKAMPSRKEQNKNNQNRNKHLHKVLSSKIESLTSNKISHELSVLKDYLNETLRIAMARITILIPQNTKNIISPLSKLWSYIYYFYNFVTNNITLWSIYIIQDSINRVFSSIDEIVSLTNNFMEQYMKIDEFNKEIIQAPQMLWYNDGTKYIYKWWNIQIDNISFGYNNFKTTPDKTKYIFQNFSLKIPGWQKLALVWASWGGKTTLIKLILGLLNTTEGSIYVDNQKLPNQNTNPDNYISLNSYYNHIWYLSQEPSVFDASILDNLLYGLKSDDTVDIESEYISDIHNALSNSDKEVFTIDVIQNISKYITKKEELSDLIAKIKSSISQSSCDFIYDYDDKLFTQIWERWIKLSWWQKQRLAIAKLMIKNPQIIVLDEPTSALDSFSEELVSKAMQSLFQNKTIIIIAHRLQTVKSADEIIVLEASELGFSYIAERWTHNQLISKWGIYAKMLELQSWF